MADEDLAARVAELEQQLADEIRTEALRAGERIYEATRDAARGGMPKDAAVERVTRAYADHHADTDAG